MFNSYYINKYICNNCCQSLEWGLKDHLNVSCFRLCHVISSTSCFSSTSRLLWEREGGGRGGRERERERGGGRERQRQRKRKRERAREREREKGRERARKREKEEEREERERERREREERERERRGEKREGGERGGERTEREEEGEESEREESERGRERRGEESVQEGGREGERAIERAIEREREERVRERGQEWRREELLPHAYTRPLLCSPFAGQPSTWFWMLAHWDKGPLLLTACACVLLLPSGEFQSLQEHTEREKQSSNSHAKGWWNCCQNVLRPQDNQVGCLCVFWHYLV